MAACGNDIACESVVVDRSRYVRAECPIDGCGELVIQCE